jgi:tetratricopeptide (TPR) repeat protein
MKRFSFSLVLFAFFTAGYLVAQTVDMQPLINYNVIENKLKKSNSAIEDPKKSIKVKTWIERGELLMDIYSIHLQYLRKGMTINEAKLFFQEPNEIKSIQKGSVLTEEYVYDRIILIFKNGILDNWLETDKIHENPLPEAKEAFEKALELDTEGREAEDLLADINRLKLLFESEAVYCYNNNDFEGAYYNFKQILDINKLDIMGGVVDTIIFYNTARVAKELGKNEDAIKYFEIVREYNYPNPFIYVFLNNCYIEVGDTASGLEVLKDGFKKFPDNQNILIELINYYLLRGIADEALDYLAIAKEEDPENISFYFAEGTLYDKLNRFEDAKRSYEYCLELDSTYFNAYYNLGVLYYNNAVKMYEEANKLNEIDEYEQAKAFADDEVVKALPYIEKAHEIDPDDIETMKTLKTLYYRMKLDDKYDKIIKELEARGEVEEEGGAIQ